MLWLEEKYIGFISSKLDKFDKKNQTDYHFRCPFCGDSAKNPNKRRGHFYVNMDKGDCYWFKCFNCHLSFSFETFLKRIDEPTFKEYWKEKLMNGGRGKAATKDGTVKVEQAIKRMEKPVFLNLGQLSKKLDKVSSLPADHPTKQYVVDRKIPNRFHYKLFHCPKFQTFTNSLLPGKFSSLKNDDPRLVIPLLSKEKQLIGFQGRALGKSEVRYITIMLDRNHSKVFNMDELDPNERHFVFEGPFDAMFIYNSIAMVGGSMDWNLLNKNSVVVYDNEPRSKETVKKINDTIDRGFKVAFFDRKVREKDINEMVLSGYTVNQIAKMLGSNTAHGLAAQLKLNEWKKV